MPQLTCLNRYALKGTAEAFTSAITALAKRVEAEGARGVLGYRFYVNPEAGTAGAVVDYAEPEAWMAHHAIAMPWPEMRVLHTAAHLTDVTFLGPMTKEIRSFLAQSGLTARIDAGYAFAAGFQRSKNG